VTSTLGAGTLVSSFDPYLNFKGFADHTVTQEGNAFSYGVSTFKENTIEGLAKNGELHPVQSAFIEHDALQCGFCTPGMVMSCTALLERMPHPTTADVEAAISGHLCRCGTYPHVIAATLAAAKTRQA